MTNDMRRLLNAKDQIEYMEKRKPYLKAQMHAQKKLIENKIQVLSEREEQLIYNDVNPTASTVDLSGRSNMTSHPMKYLVQQQRALANNLNRLEGQASKELSLLKRSESQNSAGIVGGGSPQGLQNDLNQGLSGKFRPGNVGDMNKVMWPFWFTSTETILTPNSASQGNITVTQEAAFILLSYTKAVFVEESGAANAGQFNYVDPDQAGASGKSNGLTMLIRDSQSSRQFMNRPVDINQYGHWKYPTVLPTPQLILPNSNMEITFQNNTNLITYKPFVTLFGLRVRIEDAKDILSLVSA